MPLDRTQLEEADRQIADLKHNLEQQRARVSTLKAYGQDVAEAEAALGEVEQALQDLSDYRDLLYSRIAE
jgi:multidrug resistance efflux pump